MLIPKNISPDECIYYKATFVIKALLDKGAMTITELYYEVNERCRMSFFVLTLCLDWLSCLIQSATTHEIFIFEVINLKSAQLGFTPAATHSKSQRTRFLVLTGSRERSQ